MLSFIPTQPGTGKTHYMISDILFSYKNVKHLIVQPTIALQEQTYDDLQSIAPFIKVLNDETKVSNLLAEIRLAISDSTVRVVFITEAMFYFLQPNEVERYRIWMDDCIEFSDNFITGISVSEYEQWSTIFSQNIFEVTSPYNQHFDEVQIKEPHIGMSDETIKIATMLRQNMRKFNKIAVNNDYVNNPPVSDSQKRFITLIGWHDLEVYKGHDMIFMANNFNTTLLYQYNSQYFQKLEFEGRAPIDVSRLDVRYFVPSSATTYGLTKEFIKKDHAKKAVEKMVGYINENENKFYYTSNINCPNLNGDYFPPVLRGKNNLQHYTTAVWLSCMNPTPAESKAYSKLFGFSSLAIKTERELEVLYQFITRGIIRRRDTDKKMVVYVLTEDQALYLTDTPTFIDYEIIHKKASKGGQPAVLNEEQQKRWNAFKKSCQRDKKNPGYSQEKLKEFFSKNDFSEDVLQFFTKQHNKLLEK